MNLTGKKTNATEENATAEFAAMVPPSNDGDGRDIQRLRVIYARAEHEPVGTVPPPASVKGVMKTIVQKALGRDAMLLVDKLGARLAFERTGTRLYDALLSKHDAYGTWPGGPSLAELAKIRNDEQAHMQLVFEALESLGADPTAETPAADADGVMSLGLVQLASDPRTTLAECMEAALIAELTDNACWEALVELAETFGQKRLVERFQLARVDEERHLVQVKLWLREAWKKLD